MKTKIPPKCILLSAKRLAGWFPELLYTYKNMGTSLTNLLEGFYEGKHLQLIIKHIETYKYIILSL